MCEYGFVENIDYAIIYINEEMHVIKNDYVKNISANKRSALGISIDHVMKIDMAKEISFNLTFS